MIKKIALLFGILLGCLVISGILLFWCCVEVVQKDPLSGNTPRKMVTVVFEAGQVQNIILREDVKPEIVKVVRMITKFVYYEATIHNPKGDILPDSIDDTVKEFIKEKVSL